MMNEIERAIQEFEDNLYHPSLKPTISDTSKIIALKTLQKKYDRENPNITKTKIVTPILYGGRYDLCGKVSIKSKRKWIK